MRDKGTGSVYLRGNRWWIRLMLDGKPWQESSGGRSKARAEELLKYRQENGVTFVDDIKKATSVLGSPGLGRGRKKDKFKPRVFSSRTFDPSTGGKASVAKKLKLQDFELRRRAQGFAIKANLTDGKYRPLLTTLARVSILLERAYKALKDKDSLVREDGSGELLHSVDHVRRLASTQVEMLKVVGLTPNSARVINPSNNSEIDSALLRIDNMSKLRQASVIVETTSEQLNGDGLE